MKHAIKLLCKGLDAIEDNLLVELREAADEATREEDAEEKEALLEKASYLRGQRDAYIEVRNALEDIL